MIKALIYLMILSHYVFLLPPDHRVFIKLYALEGTWKMNTKRGSIYEEWKKIDNTYLQSKGFMIKGNDTIINERVALKNTKDGIYYTSTVENQNNKQPIAFKLTTSDHNQFIFENLQHDFPKRIGYQLVTKDSLHAWIDDAVEGSKHRQDFYYKKQ
jgi:hypothetical protein